CSIDLPTVADLSTSAGTTIKWYTNSTGGSALSSGTTIATATTYYATQTVAGCESDTRLAVAVTVADPDAPTGDAIQSFCSIDLPTVANLSTSTGTAIKWYANPTGGSALSSGTTIATATTYWGF
ncbi:MAG: hypothetical protein JKY43_10575, partial [Phycisphaerales bacterium]|nr:hypothetical protein [Phycisphaerales bacterium]